jgi:GNAT superfamily N-acetyltransferase
VPTPSAFLIRRATLTDADAFTAQRRALYHETDASELDRAGHAFDSATRAAFLAGITRESILVWLALSDADKVIGSTALYVIERLPSLPNPRPAEGYLGHMFVAPQWRRAGVGSALVRAAQDEARARSLGRIRLHATESGRALYASLGFTLRVNEMEIRV